MTPHNAFEFVRKAQIESLGVDVEEYRHKVTGAQHLHIAADNDENVFLVALRTVPSDSTGVAHILEHTALCGSEKYPVRDPFFMMIRRSLNTFMNAFTSSDWTAYPFASQNRKDFDNLLDVYLDAVFFSRLDELDFAQEGHRLEFAETDNPDSELKYKGVVFNEMKGAMSSVASQLWHTLCKYLFPTTTYHHNSGGDPESIVDLTYEQLVHFYRTHYHPSNAIFMTFGDIPAAEHQQAFEERALHRFERLDKTISVGLEKRYQAPVSVQEAYPLGEHEDSEEKTHIVLGWLLGDGTSLENTLTAHLLSGVLLDNSASPLQHYLETTPLGTAPSPLCGLDDSQRELLFVCGIEGSERDRADQFEQEVLALLGKIAREGVPYEQLEASLHQLELQQREVGGDSYPYGLQLILTALTGATHRGDAIGLLNIDPVLADLREKIKDPTFIAQKARELLVDNQHRVRLVMVPDKQIAQRKEDAEAAQLAQIKGTLDDAQKEQIIERARALAERQQQVDDPEILPKVGVEDVRPETHDPEAENVELPNGKLARYPTGTNGLVYQQMVCALPDLTERERQLFPFYSAALTELGVGSKDYLAVQHWQAAVCGGLHGFSTTRGGVTDTSEILGNFIFSGKALGSNQTALSELMDATLHDVRFDELPRIRELLLQTLAGREQSVVGNGHALAMAAACAGMNSVAALGHESGGLKGLKNLKQIVAGLTEQKNLEDIAATYQSIHNKILGAKRQFLLIGEQEKLDEYSRSLEKIRADGSNEGGFNLSFEPRTVNEVWVANSQVNFCSRAYATVPMSHPDAAPLAVLAGFLRNGYLHRTIREQGGAYGGGASHDSNIGAFRFYSYRDPRMAETLADFDASLEWLQETKHNESQVEEAILGVIGGIDKPGSPAGEAKRHFHSELFGRTHALRTEFRSRVIGTTVEDLQRVAKTYLQPERANTAVVTGTAGRSAGEVLGLAPQVLALQD
ncbi:insulinase family protein [Biformimicrobium ophioploci]|uniref:Insulinase family protein n=1 Tax=Biformimicrobium ophioploci TaxID=3036711 RepID=A0ABQ6M1G0_9GAMM|nr:insulinase family protein [Microbulbifer sp. NKW57]GMG88122.1 insulinase family protein [Microbulbifer sp. NKW57]